jgi:osmotically-inducible protein OsmY
MFKARIVTAACALLLFGSAAYATDPDNTAKNARDKDGGKLTVFDQGGSEADRNTTAEIRKAIVGDDSLSTNAHNVKIITVDGKVTLRGPVETSAEKTKVEMLAKNVAGASHVKSELEIDPN